VEEKNYKCPTELESVKANEPKHYTILIIDPKKLFNHVNDQIIKS